jgi:hypothetical protein
MELAACCEPGRIAYFFSFARRALRCSTIFVDACTSR